MKSAKWAILVAFFLAVILSMQACARQAQTPETAPILTGSPSQSIEELLSPIDDDIRSYFEQFESPDEVTDEKIARLRKRLLVKHRERLLVLVCLLAQKEGVLLTPTEEERMMYMILDDEIARISQEFLEQWLGGGTPTLESIDTNITPLMTIPPKVGTIMTRQAEEVGK